MWRDGTVRLEMDFGFFREIAMPPDVTRAAAEALVMDCLREMRPGRDLGREALVVKELNLDSLAQVEWFMAIENLAEERFGLSITIDYSPIDRALGDKDYDLGCGGYKDAYATVNVGQVVDQIVLQLTAPVVV